MIKLAPVLLLVSCSTQEPLLAPSGYSLFDSSKSVDQVSDILEKADHHFNYDSEGQLTPPLDSLAEGAPRKFATVRFEKNAPWIKSREEVMPEIESLLFSLGFQRIVFTGAHSRSIIIIRDSRSPRLHPQ